MTRRLSPAEAIGITGDEAPLTPDDLTAVARRIYTPTTAADVLTGHPERTRRDHASGGGRHLAYYCERRGVWARLGAPPRAGLIRWRDLEAALRRNATPAAVQHLIDAAAAHRAHADAYNHAWAVWKRGPARGAGDPPAYDVDTAGRLEAEARRALAAVLDGAVQDALFPIGAS